MIVHVRDDLRSRRAVVLHHIPVDDARGAAQRRRQDAQPVAELAGLGGRCSGEFGGVAPRAEEKVAVGEGHDVEEGDDQGRGEEDVGLGVRGGESWG